MASMRSNSRSMRLPTSWRPCASSTALLRCLIAMAVAASQRPPMRNGPPISAPTAYSNWCTGRRAAYRNTMPRTARTTIDSAGFSGQIIQA